MIAVGLRFVQTFLLLFAVALCPRAHAQPVVGPVAPVAPADEEEGYGHYVVMADLASVAAAFVLAPSFGLAAVAPYALASPTVHLAHGHGDRAFTSLMLHVGAPLLGGVAGYHIEKWSGCESEMFCGFGGAGLGILAGAITATAVDAAHLAKGSSSREGRWTSRVTPALAFSPTGAMVGVSGGL